MNQPIGPDERGRFRGCLLGLACGDAVGTTVEFTARGRFKPVTDMVGGGVFQLPPGAWTDDTSMALCLASSLTELGRFDPDDQMRRYWRWVDDGYLSSTGRCFKETVLLGHGVDDATSPKIREIAQGEYRGKREADVRGSGYVVQSLEAPLWCFWQTSSFEAAVLKAANLGDDADTTAAVCGQVAGAFYGEQGIPAHWLERLVMREAIADLADRLHEGQKRGTVS
ncbi:MAG: ADP-ribosylglycohydrolase family protein [Isosphaeraceae bacterium]